MTIIGEAWTHEALARVIAQRRQSMGLTQADLGYLAGLQDGYMAKLELGEQGTFSGKRKTARTFGPKSLFSVLRPLGLRLVIVEDKP